MTSLKFSMDILHRITVPSPFLFSLSILILFVLWLLSLSLSNSLCIPIIYFQHFLRLPSILYTLSPYPLFWFSSFFLSSILCSRNPSVSSCIFSLSLSSIYFSLYLSFTLSFVPFATFAVSFFPFIYPFQIKSILHSLLISNFIFLYFMFFPSPSHFIPRCLLFVSCFPFFFGKILFI
jgi:hypothetical protein